MNKLKTIWLVLTKDDWFIIRKTPPEYPFYLWIGQIEVIYHEAKS